jgi:hypothetical protein
LGVFGETKMLSVKKTNPAKSSLCPRGRYSVIYQKSNYCMSCKGSSRPECHAQQGTYSSTQCAGGHYFLRYADKSFCISCPPGKYSTSASAPEPTCSLCPLGRYQPAPHQTSCLSCLATGC